MPRPDRSNAIDHVVVIMFENRSFDNLLGRLYEPGEVASFAGVTGLDLSNPVPEWAADAGTAPKLVPYGTAVGMNVPSPDPGEEYQHVNTQLFGLIDPPSNRGMVAQHIVAPYNAPADAGQPPTMDGFITDYISAFMAETGRPPVFEEYAQIMTGYVPLQVPVTSALARGFATFDHWFCEVPSQTFPNRSFFHAGTSSGLVVNISLTGIIHAPRLLDRFETNFFTTDQFLADAANGQLPTYSFIEPNLLYGHNDMHPAFDALFPGVDLDPPSALLGGEALLAKIYDAIRTSSTPDGSNAYNTLLMITFDEHGGTYDHVPPPPVPPPDPSAPAGQMGFTFGRSGVRVPAIAVSAWIGENTVITDEYRHTSVIRTLRERWQLGAPLTGRDGAARDLAPALSQDSPRDPADWPEVVPQPVPPFVPARISLEARLKGLSRAACFPVLALAKNLGLPAPDIGEDEAMARADAMELIDDVFGDMFPGLHTS
jgi:phospholipase C